MSEKNVTYDTRYGTLPTAESDKEYTFAGWYTLPVGGDKVNSETKYTSLEESVILYAHWTRTIKVGDHIKVIHSYIPEGQNVYQTPESRPESVTVHLYRKLKGEADSEYICISEKEVNIQDIKKAKDEQGRDIDISEADYEFVVTDSSSDYEYRVGTRLDNYDLVKPKGTGSDYPYKGITESKNEIDFELQFNPNNFPADWKVEYVTSGEAAVPEDKRIIDAANVKILYGLTRTDEYKDIVQHNTMAVATDMVRKTSGTASFPVWKYQSDEEKSTYYYKARVSSYTIGGKEVKTEDSLYKAVFDENTIMYYDKTNDRPSNTMVIKIYYRGVNVSFDLNNENADASTCPQSYDMVPDRTIMKPADPTARHYSFAGWYKDKECTKNWNFETDKVTADTILYAKWNKKEYTDTVLVQTKSSASASYQQNNAGGYVEVTLPAIAEDRKQIKSSGYSYTCEAQSSITLSVTVNPGYTFEGWYETSGEGIEKVSEEASYTYSMTGNHTVYARFKPNTDTRVFDSALQIKSRWKHGNMLQGNEAYWYNRNKNQRCNPYCGTWLQLCFRL